MVTIEQIAKVAHAANIQIQKNNGEIPSPPWDDLPLSQRQIILNGVAQVLANPRISARQLHENWKSKMLKAGWKYAPVRNDSKREHPNIVDWEKLPEGQRLKDMIFAGIVNGAKGWYRDES